MSLFEQDRIEEKAEFADGVYFSMSEADYHALPRLSASGIKGILISLPTFWAKSWMNKDRDPVGDETKAKTLGSCYHCAIFEPESLADRYVGSLDLSEYDNLLTTDAAVKAELKALGLKQTEGNETAVMRALRLMEADPSFSVKSVIVGEFEEGLEGRQVIDRKYWDQVMQDVERIRANPEIHELVTGGASEVTILWTCPESGIPMKARIDKLKVDCFVDLKSFANKNGKPVNRAIRDQIMYYQYHLSMRVYQVAISMIRVLDLQAMDVQKLDMTRQDHKNLELVEALRTSSNPHQPWLFFQEKGGIPNLLARKLRLQTLPDGVDIQSIGAEGHQIKMNDSVLCRKADMEIARAKQLFRQAMDIYGDEGNPWYPLDMLGEIADADFLDWFLEEIPA